jgi:hypothetical protein
MDESVQYNLAVQCLVQRMATRARKMPGQRLIQISASFLTYDFPLVLSKPRLAKRSLLTFLGLHLQVFN